MLDNTKSVTTPRLRSVHEEGWLDRAVILA
ncbi:hypothetical protein PC112_g17202 [Phytophthora cactorum]|nr:hypothetical protein PC112_g17202 [Phytophthora cactorum]